MYYKNIYSKIDRFYSSEELTTVKILATVFSILPIAYIVIIATSLLNKDYAVVCLLIVALLITLSSQWLLVRGYFSKSIWYFVLSNILIITVISTLGQGIHDIAIVAFPPILLFSGQLLYYKEQLVITGLIMIAVSWLAFGEMYGVFIPEEPTSIISELIIALTILGIGSVVSFRVANGLRAALIKDQIEIEKRKLGTIELEETLTSKKLLTTAVHGRITKNLEIIREIFDLTGKNSLTSFTQTLHDRILAIEVIHERLNANKGEKKLDIGDYLDSLSSRFVDLYNWQKIEVKSKDLQISIEQAMSIGLFVNEILTQISSKTKIQMSVNYNDLKIELVLNFDQAIKPISTELSKIMIQQIRGEVMSKEGQVVMSFPFDPTK